MPQETIISIWQHFYLLAKVVESGINEANLGVMANLLLKIWQL